MDTIIVMVFALHTIPPNRYAFDVVFSM